MCGMSGLQRAQKGLCHTHLSLSPCTCYRLQLASSLRLWCLRITATGSAPAYSHSLLRIYIQKSGICEWATPRGTITERHKITFQNIFVHRSWLVEWSSHPHQESWMPDNFQATAENSPDSMQCRPRSGPHLARMDLTRARCGLNLGQNYVAVWVISFITIWLHSK